MSSLGITVYEDGTFWAHDACTMDGEWTLGNGEIDFQANIITGVRCQSEIGIENLTAGRVTGDTLTVIDEGGSAIVELTRSAPG